MRDHGRRGGILLMTMMCIMAVAVFALVFLDTVLYNNRNAANQYNDAYAFYLAEAGFDKAAWSLINIDGGWRTSLYPDLKDAKKEVLGDGSYTMWVEDFSGAILITAQGAYQDRLRTVQQVVNYLPGSPPSVDLKLGEWKEL